MNTSADKLFSENGSPLSGRKRSLDDSGFQDDLFEVHTEQNISSLLNLRSAIEEFSRPDSGSTSMQEGGDESSESQQSAYNMLCKIEALQHQVQQETSTRKQLEMRCAVLNSARDLECVKLKTLAAQFEDYRAAHRNLVDVHIGEIEKLEAEIQRLKEQEAAQVANNNNGGSTTTTTTTTSTAAVNTSTVIDDSSSSSAADDLISNSEAIAQLTKERDLLFREVTRLQSSKFDALESGSTMLIAAMEDIVKERDQLRNKVVDLTVNAGHHNNKQKIHYVDQLKGELKHYRDLISKLQRENFEKTTQIAKMMEAKKIDPKAAVEKENDVAVPHTVTKKLFTANKKTKTQTHPRGGLAARNVRA